MKLILVINTMHTCIQVAFKNTFTINPHVLVLRFSQNPSTNVMKTAHIMPLNIKIFDKIQRRFQFFLGKTVTTL